MKQVAVSDELYDQLKNFIVDPFDDTLETVIGRLISITGKARDRWPGLGPVEDVDIAGISVTEQAIDAVLPAAEVADLAAFESREVGQPSTL